MKIRSSFLALGAFFVIAVGIAGCGSGMPGNSVADVAGNPISTQAFNHWMYVAAASQAAQNPGQPVIVPNDPPNFNACIAQVKKDIPSLAKTKTATLRTDCKQLFTSLSSQVLDFLIKAYWYQADAAKMGIKVTDAEVQKAFTTAKNQQFPTAAGYNTFLNQTGQTNAGRAVPLPGQRDPAEARRQAHQDRHQRGRSRPTTTAHLSSVRVPGDAEHEDRPGQDPGRR